LLDLWREEKRKSATGRQDTCWNAANADLYLVTKILVITADVNELAVALLGELRSQKGVQNVSYLFCVLRQSNSLLGVIDG
jgi:hypothetical protein